ncbi:MAG: hypothetical protein PF904_11680 [Kiritimatiellae bacterium]|jgi:hypothetical protein|nr:hypothetical protein [Kiritimatiellia bacterium]
MMKNQVTSGRWQVASGECVNSTNLTGFFGNIRRLFISLRLSQCTRRYLSGAITVLVLLLTTTSNAASDVNRFIWDQANTQMSHATKSDDYLKAAESYNRLLRNGIVNAPLLINLGTALTMGGDTVNAQTAFERAELYSGTTPEIKNGLVAALARQTNKSDIELPWYRTAFFWHFDTRARLRIIIALIGWSLLWVGILLYLIRNRYTQRDLQYILTLSETCMITGALILLIFSASSIFTLIQERNIRSHWASVQFANTATSQLEGDQ